MDKPKRLRNIYVSVVVDGKLDCWTGPNPSKDLGAVKQALERARLLEEHGHRAYPVLVREILEEDTKGYAAEFYKLADYLTLAEREQFGLPSQSHPVMAKRTGEFRPPRAGEWYLSGAIPEAYRASNDLDSAYHILTLVRVEPCFKEV